tara:strand:- start:58 stop:342 length:285 start_codon:yes stop_codon:yes gene_type:complete
MAKDGYGWMVSTRKHDGIAEAIVSRGVTATGVDLGPDRRALAVWTDVQRSAIERCDSLDDYEPDPELGENFDPEREFRLKLKRLQRRMQQSRIR